METLMPEVIRPEDDERYQQILKTTLITDFLNMLYPPKEELEGHNIAEIQRIRELINDYSVDEIVAYAKEYGITLELKKIEDKAQKFYELSLEA